MNMKYLHLMMIFLLGCSSSKTINLNRPVETLPSWFKTDENFALRDSDGGYVIHPFFDSDHHLDEKTYEVNFILVTPEKSEFRYFMDLVSGSLVVDQKYCEQNDVWNRSTSTVKYPPYSVGVIPRWLNSMGAPQEIYVFGRAGFYGSLSKTFEKTYHARIIGGVNLQYCPKKLCRAEDWLSDIIPIAVDPQDSKFAEINTMDELKKEVNWEEIVLFMQNGKGRTLRTAKDFPNYRLLSIVSAKSALKFMTSKAYEFKYEKMIKMRNSCHALYTYVWDSIKTIREQETKKSDDQIIKEFTGKFFNRNVYSKTESEEITEQIFKEKTKKSFADWFSFFHQKLGDEFKTCSRYTRMGNFSVDREQFWFFVYLDLFFKMEEVGYLYNCDSRAWIKNFKNADGGYVYDQNKFLKECTSADLDRGFETASNHMLDLQNNGLEHYRYIGQDHSLGGSHQGVYHWVNFSGKKFRCEDEDEQKENDEMISRLIFENDSPWKRFSGKEADRYDIIR